MPPAKRSTKSPAPEPATSAPAAQPSPPPLVIGSLDDLLGQDHAIRLLRAAAESRRIHHAWIFHGPPGVGKFTAAVAFAALLLDPTTAPDLSGRLAPDPDSQTQQLLRAGAHPDLHIITKELAAISSEKEVRDSKQRVIPVAVIREFVVAPAQKTRSVAGNSLAGKAFIIDEAELMATNAQDIMLKTLEEPGPGTVLILITASEDRLQPTVRSRCQRIAFAPLDDSALGAWYKRAGMPAEPAAQRQWLLKYAAGSPGWIQAAVEHGLYQWHETLAPMLDAVDAGRPAPELGAALHSLVEEKAASWVKANPDASKEAANFAWARRMLAYLAERARLGFRTAAAAGATNGSAASQARGERFAAIMDAISAAETHAATNVNLQFVMENLAARLTMQAMPANWPTSTAARR